MSDKYQKDIDLAKQTLRSEWSEVGTRNGRPVYKKGGLKTWWVSGQNCWCTHWLGDVTGQDPLSLEPKLKEAKGYLENWLQNHFPNADLLVVGQKYTVIRSSDDELENDLNECGGEIITAERVKEEPYDWCVIMTKIQRGDDE